MLWWSQLNVSATNKHSISLGYGHKSNSLASPFERISEGYKLAWTDFYCHHDHLFQHPQLFHSYLRVTTTASAVFHIRTAISSGRLKGFPQSSLVWIVPTASCLLQGSSWIEWLSQRCLKRITIGLLLIWSYTYSCPTAGVSPDELNFGQVKPNNNSLNPFCLKVVIQTKIRCGVTPIILLPLYLQSKLTQNWKNLWNWSKLNFFDSYRYQLVQAYRSLYQKEDFQSVKHCKDHSRSAHWQTTLGMSYLLV